MQPLLAGALLASTLAGSFPGTVWDAFPDSQRIVQISPEQTPATREGVAALMDRCLAGGFNTVAIDAKPSNGLVAYASKVAPRLDDNFDFLAVACEEAHQRGLKVHAWVNGFVEGDRRDRIGPAYDHPQWAAISYEPTSYIAFQDREMGIAAINERPREGLTMLNAGYGRPYPGGTGVVVAVSDNHVTALLDQPKTGFPVPDKGFLLVGESGSREAMRGLRLGDPVQLKQRKQIVSETQRGGSGAVYVNPNLPEIQSRFIEILTEVAKYPIDGMTLGEMGFGGLTMDFSDTSRRLFEGYLGKEISRWPVDVLDFSPTGEVIRGPHYKSWIEWRSKTIQGILERARTAVRKVKPNLSLSCSVPSLYPFACESGLNWASKGYRPGYDWASSRYQDTALASSLDSLYPVMPATESIALMRERSERTVYPVLSAGLDAERIAPTMQAYLKECGGVVVPQSLLDYTQSWALVGSWFF